MRARRIDPRKKVDTVLNEARRLFVEHGFHRVSIPMVASAAFTGELLRNIELCYQGIIADVILDHALRAMPA